MNRKNNSLDHKKKKLRKLQLTNCPIPTLINWTMCHYKRDCAISICLPQPKNGYPQRLLQTECLCSKGTQSRTISSEDRYLKPLLHKKMFHCIHASPSALPKATQSTIYCFKNVTGQKECKKKHHISLQLFRSKQKKDQWSLKEKTRNF